MSTPGEADQEVGYYWLQSCNGQPSHADMPINTLEPALWDGRYWWTVGSDIELVDERAREEFVIGERIPAPTRNLK